MKTRHCDECQWFARESNEHVCRKHHKPRFYKPRYSYDPDWGWKRKCSDFEEAKK